MCSSLPGSLLPLLSNSLQSNAGIIEVMSSDTGKDNASVVDSSITEGRHDMGTVDNPESTSKKRNEGCYPTRSEEPRSFHDKLGDSAKNENQNLYNARYFIIKSLNYQNIQLSVERGIWATQVMNEPILEEAFNNSAKVILIFSVNMSGFFQGYAQMISSIGWRRDNVWSQGNGRSNPWGRSFKVKWLCLNELPFQKTLHLRNPLNNNRPVKISRDCQELPQDVGETLCELLDGNIDANGQTIRSFLDSTCSSQDEDYNGLPAYMQWPSAPMPYPSTLYQQQPEAGRFDFHYQGSAGILPPENLLAISNASKMGKSKKSCDLPALIVDMETSSQYDIRSFSNDSPLASTLTEDEFLEMSYEEYLEAHGKSSRQPHHPVSVPFNLKVSHWTPKESPKTQKHNPKELPNNRKRDHELDLSYGPQHSRSHKRANHSSQR
ncbi:hypothetical protein SAY86_000703 [Trapa natans]|uniref:YTH domain-containing family protein n=1 Tax=Trapa natans TaxID=22666 RepID=A0AAN7MAS0_TRANT|nr:hypothetical protein SAY86_000703 [Trapa natans]